jgi:flagellar biosynthesis chaperone FliJ
MKLRIGSLKRNAKLTRRKGDLAKIRTEKGNITTDVSEIRRILQNYYEQLYTNTLYNLEERNTWKYTIC